MGQSRLICSRRRRRDDEHGGDTLSSRRRCLIFYHGQHTCLSTVCENERLSHADWPKASSANVLGSGGGKGVGFVNTVAATQQLNDIEEK